MSTLFVNTRAVAVPQSHQVVQVVIRIVGVSPTASTHAECSGWRRQHDDDDDETRRDDDSDGSTDDGLTSGEIQGRSSARAREGRTWYFIRIPAHTDRSSLTYYFVPGARQTTRLYRLGLALVSGPGQKEMRVQVRTRLDSTRLETKRVRPVTPSHGSHPVRSRILDGRIGCTCGDGQVEHELRSADLPEMAIRRGPWAMAHGKGLLDLLVGYNLPVVQCTRVL